ncbi:MAG: hypothetical protein GWP15_02430 [Nitrospirae bacterium]|nr:hypothetical protein [Nitrospirota bacterium]
MPDENTQNPKKEKTFTIDQEELQANPETPVKDPTEAVAGSGAQQPTQEPANPLNTGNGTPEAPVKDPTEAVAGSGVKTPTEPPAEPTPKTPVDITPETPAETPAKPVEDPAESGENLEQKLDDQLTEATESTPEAQDAKDATISSKKYLIMVIVVIALLAGGYFIYTYFIAGPAETETNTLSPTKSVDETTGEPSEAMEKLDEIVDELENVYAPPAEGEIDVFEEAVLEEVDNSFPSLTEPVAEEPVPEKPVEEVVLEEPALYEPLLGEPPVAEPVIDEPLDLKVLR